MLIPEKMHGPNLLPFLTHDLDPAAPILIAGPTASGKSSLAMEIAERAKGTIINADALQVYNCWQILTARPSAMDEATTPHRLYGYVGKSAGYSVGQWLKDVKSVLAEGTRPIFVGGTGLYFRALTEGLANIPPIPDHQRQQVQSDLNRLGPQKLAESLHPDDQSRIDVQNGARVGRALEIYRTTGRSMAAFHAETPAPLIDLGKAAPILMNTDKDWLNQRIGQRFGHMVHGGALQEVAQNMAVWNDSDPAFQAIGAPELKRHLLGECPLQAAIEDGIVSTRQYAKRQRTWFRKRMSGWYNLRCSDE